MKIQAGVKVLVLVVTVSVVGSNPVPKPSVPFWHSPCGVSDDTEVQSFVNDEEIERNLENIKLQHRLAMDDFLNRDYEFLYERVRLGVHDHQYIPNWVPGKKDVHNIRKLYDAPPQTVIDHLPKFHLDLQKFAVAFEQLLIDEEDAKIRRALGATGSYLIMMLCEVESSISVLPSINVPARVQRSIMTSNERNPIDETRRLVRDWGVLLKYKDYLHAWRHVFKY